VLAGRRCRLVRRHPLHAAFVRQLWADPGFLAMFNPAAGALPESDAELRGILASEFATLIDNGRSLHWAIETLDGRAFGVASLTGISLAHRRAEFLVGVLRPPYTGAATEATLLALDFAFGPLQLQKITALIPADNAASLAGSAHIGFVREGLLARHILHPNTREPIDLVAMAAFAGDEQAAAQQARVRRRLLRPATLG
jgi:RimJ/RimL family protein N-acetyltransferase